LRLWVDDVGRSVEDDILMHTLPQYFVSATSKVGKRLEPIAWDHAMLPWNLIQAIFASRADNPGAETAERAGERVKSWRCASALEGSIGLRLPEIVRVILFVALLANIG
jgi:hypothetical protein